MPRLDAPNAQAGAELVAKHGGVDEAMMAYEPDSPEFDHIQAYRYVSTGQAPDGLDATDRLSGLLDGQLQLSCGRRAARTGVRLCAGAGSDVTTSGS